MKKAFQFLILIFLLLPSFLLAQNLAPGGPGKDAQWATAAKQGVGTSATTASKVWFTLAQGVMTEVYYPDVTTANVHMLQFFVKDQDTGKVETEMDDSFHSVKVVRPDALTFQQINAARSGKWKIVKTYTTDPHTDSVLIEVQFKPNRKHLALYVFFDPSLGNSGMHDTAERYASYLTAHDGKYASALLFSDPASPGATIISEQTNGFYGKNDGLMQIRETLHIGATYEKAEDGNVAQTALVFLPKHFTVVLAFGETQDDAVKKAIISQNKGFAKCLAEYEQDWSAYVRTLPKVDAGYQAQFNMAAMQLKAHEDKTHPGANIASLSVPWGGGANANENTVGGYHLVWSRDLYQVATAYMALGDTAAAKRALDFVFNVQQKPDGSFPQNSMLDGKPFWGSVQLDEVAFPLILAYQLGRYDKKLYENHVKKAADYIVKNGPSTPQERWEEESGYSPSTIAAEIAGLVCAAEIAKKNGDQKSADLWLKTADEWQSNIEKWTATSTGKYGDGRYYLRITQNGRPDAGDKIELNNGAGIFDERDIVDAGFLELVRLGIKPADDPLIEKSLAIIDRLIKVDTPNGPAFYRYNFDGYGEMEDGRRWNWDGKYTGKGRLWALLSGERGQYALARSEKCDPGPVARTDRGKGSPVLTVQQNKCLSEQAVFLSDARSRLAHMLAFANDGLMFPEQIWDKKEVPANIDRQFIPRLEFGEGTGSATPLAWSTAQFIRLALNLKAGRNLETPDVVYRRYNKY
jgi:glucoamylase